MGKLKRTLLSSLIKKFVMAITGFVLASFLLVHMLGNLQMLEGGPNAINAYANFLQTLPWEFLWGFRIVLAACFVLHFLTAFLLVVENRNARPQAYAVKKSLASSPAARTMIYSGIIILLFAIVHIMHYTVINLNPELKELDWVATSGMYEGKTIHDVYAMMIVAFSNDWVAIAYIVSMILIGFHLSHGVSSMFQSVGMRDEKWRYRLNAIAVIYCTIVAAGFSLNPLSVLVSKYTPCQILPQQEVMKQFDAQKAQNKTPIFIDYNFLKNCKTCSSTAPVKAK